jgi:hypothetical protein
VIISPTPIPAYKQWQHLFFQNWPQQGRIIRATVRPFLVLYHFFSHYTYTSAWYFVI